jgi:mRNA interferase MazF
MVTTVDKTYIPSQGDLIWLEFNPQAGREQSGLRPALVISPHLYNSKVGLALMCPITSQIKGYPFEVILPAKHKISGAILADQIKSLDWRTRKAKFVCKTPTNILAEVIAKIQTIITNC